MAIVVINAILGFIQEYKAERSLEEIKKLSSPYAMVIRDGQRCKIPAADLVPGDVILLEAGDRVPADIRLFKTSGLELDESALTGESLPVEKNAELVYPASTLPADQRNMAFMGTVVTRGRGQG
jgi:Ca2+-transporting ATPase